MQSETRGKNLLLHDQPGCFHLFGLFFLLLGTLAAAASLGLANNAEELTIYERLLAFALGLTVVAAGLYVIYRAQGSRITADPETRTLTIRRRGLSGRWTESYLFSEIRDFYLAQKEDIDGDPVFSLRMRLADGKEVALTNLWLPNRKGLEENISQLNSILSEG